MIKEEKARKALISTITGFRKVRTKEQILKNIGWYDFSSGVHDLELTTKIVNEEINNIQFEI